MERTLTIIRSVFAGIGVVAFFLAIFFTFQTLQLLKTGVTAPGVVISLERHSGSKGSDTYAPVVQFETPDGQTIQFTGMASSPPTHRENEKVTVIYEPSSPHNAKINSFTGLWLGPLIAGFITLMFGGIGWGMIIYRRTRLKIIERLKNSGRPLNTRFIKVELHGSFRVNGRSPWRIFSQYDDGAGNVYVFHSENLWFDPEQYIQKDRSITVFVDGQNMKKYYMNIGFLSEQR